MSDPCCALCESKQFGICLSRYQCRHHKQAQAQDEADYRATSTVRRPTEDRAIGNVMREQQRMGKPR